jgi:hypothetical protein
MTDKRIEEMVRLLKEGRIRIVQSAGLSSWFLEPDPLARLLEQKKWQDDQIDHLLSE